MSALQVTEQPKRVLSHEAKERAREMFFKNVPDDVLEVVWGWAERYGLDVFAGHIVALPFKNKEKSAKAKSDVYDYVPYVTRDGALHHAMQSGLLVSFQSFPGVQLATGREYCEVFVYRRDTNIPTRMTLFMDEWKPKGETLEWSKNAMWKSKPSMMLQKTAIRQAVLQAIPLTIPVLAEDSSYFDTVMSAARGFEIETSQQPQLPVVPDTPQIDAPVYPAGQLMDIIADPVIEGEAVTDPTPPTIDPDVLEKVRLDIDIDGESTFGVDGWQIKRASLIRGVKSGAKTMTDLTGEELTRLRVALTAAKMGYGGNRRL